MTDEQCKRIVNAINGVAGNVLYLAFMVYVGLLLQTCAGHR